jgi:NAD-dependent deacetylase
MRKNIVFFSGAGMSAESGINTFRDSGGLWEQYSIEEIATPQAWKLNPTLVTEFYNQRRKQIIETEPNAAHNFIAELQNRFTVQVITQNIDDLHERAGSKDVLHLHGNIRLAKSSGPDPENQYYPISGWKLTESDLCDDGFRLRPHVVWFGESVPNFDQAIQLIEKADYFVVIGTSLQVYPAANLVHFCHTNTQKYIIDPHVESFQIPSDFIQIPLNATAGVHELRNLFLNSF